MPRPAQAKRTRSERRASAGGVDRSTAESSLTQRRLDRYSRPTMAKKTSKVEIVLEGEERILMHTYADGTEVRTPIVKGHKKERRNSRPYWYWELATGRRKFF